MSWLLSNLQLIGGGIVAALLLAVKFFSAKAKREGKRADRAEAQAEYVEEVRDRDTETRKKFDSRRAAAKDEISKGTVPDHLRNPNG